jgi:hypothetical protein
MIYLRSLLLGRGRSSSPNLSIAVSIQIGNEGLLDEEESKRKALRFFRPGVNNLYKRYILQQDNVFLHTQLAKN